ncbi:MAG TPA: polysaccharide biosynthesis/export family protein [Longimicrobiales bacterium]|nr:polysaccharide biosynthesis/export family protein [Longimicrobiales bacterium]
MKIGSQWPTTLLVALLPLLAPAPAAAQLASAASATGVLNPGDFVELIVWRNGEMSGQFEIQPDSTLGHPLLRSVKVAGVSLREAEERLRVALGRFETNPQLVLLPRYRVFVLGEVASPGLHTFSPNVTVFEAVMLAGASEQTGRLDRVRLIRNGQRQVIDVRQVDSFQASQLIRSGDQIVVERRRHLLRDYVLPVISFTGSVTAILTFVDILR